MKTKKIILGLWLITLVVEIALAIASYIYSVPLSTYILLAILIAALNFMLISVIDTSNWNDRDFMEERNRIRGEGFNSNLFETKINHEPLGCPRCNSSKVTYDSELNSLECIDCGFLEFKE